MLKPPRDRAASFLSRIYPTGKISAAAERITSTAECQQRTALRDRSGSELRMNALITDVFPADIFLWPYVYWGIVGAFVMASVALAI